MKTTTSMKFNRTILGAALVALFILLTASACTFTGVPVPHGNSMDIQATLNESDVNTLLSDSHNHVQDKSHDLLDQITSVDMQDGLIRVYGTRTNRGETVSGSYDVTLKAEDGALKAQIVAVNIPGMSLDDPRVQNANQEIARSLSRSAAENRDNVTFTSVKITDSAMQVNLSVRWNQK
jgi:hypothetical protein